MAHETDLWNPVLIKDRANIPDMNLLYAEFANEEYIHIETDEDGQTVMWSSSMRLVDFLEQSRTIMGVPADNKDWWSYVSFHGGNSIEGSPAEVEALAKANADEVVYYTCGYEDAVTAWRSPRVKMKVGSIPYVEATIASDHLTKERAMALLSVTATAEVIKAVGLNPTPLLRRLEDTA